MHRDDTRQGCTYLPLPVWKKIGFNIEKIRTLSKPEDIEEHDVLGTTYRSSLKNVTTSTIDDVCRMQLLTMRQNKSQVKAGPRGLGSY